MRVSVSFDEIISSPLDGLDCMMILASVGNFSTILNNSPGEHSYSKCHWQTKLHIVTSIIVPSHQVHLHIIPIKIYVYIILHRICIHVYICHRLSMGACTCL